MTIISSVYQLDLNQRTQILLEAAKAMPRKEAPKGTKITFVEDGIVLNNVDAKDYKFFAEETSLKILNFDSSLNELKFVVKETTPTSGVVVTSAFNTLVMAVAMVVRYGIELVNTPIDLSNEISYCKHQLEIDEFEMH